MNKLLGANFMRLKQSKVFWVCMLLSAGFALMMDFSPHTMLREGSEPTLDGNLFSFCTVYRNYRRGLYQPVCRCGIQ